MIVIVCERGERRWLGVACCISFTVDFHSPMCLCIRVGWVNAANGGDRRMKEWEECAICKLKWKWKVTAPCVRECVSVLCVCRCCWHWLNGSQAQKLWAHMPADENERSAIGERPKHSNRHIERSVCQTKETSDPWPANGMLRDGIRRNTHTHTSDE